MAFALVSAGCANWPKPELVDTFLTSGGARVWYARCNTVVVAGEYTFKFQYVRVEKGGKTRTDPKIRLDKPGLTELTSTQANGVLRQIDHLWRDVCADMRAPDPGFAKLASEFYGRVIELWFETAFRFEVLTTEQEFQAEIISSRAQFEELRSVQQNGYRVAGGGN